MTELCWNMLRHEWDLFQLFWSVYIRRLKECLPQNGENNEFSNCCIEAAYRTEDITSLIEFDSSVIQIGTYKILLLLVSIQAKSFLIWF